MPQFRDPGTLEGLSCQVLLSVLYHLTVKHDHDVSQSTSRRQFLVASVLSAVKQRLISIITSNLNQDLNVTCKLLDYTLDNTVTQLDLCARKFSSFSFPVEQVQTVYRLLARGEPAALERLCMGIDLGGIEDREEEEEKDEKEIINWYTGAVKRKEDTVSKVLVYNSYFYPTLERMKKLRHVVLHGVCDNQTLAIMGQNCNVLQFLDCSGSSDVTDVGIQNLVFPPAIQKAGRVNLVNTRARTNPSAKQLHTVLARGTGVDVTGCIILLQFCPRLTKGGGRLEHDNIGEAIFILNKKLKVSNIILKELIDMEMDEAKENVFSQIISKLEIIKTTGKSLPRINSLCSPNNSISELYLDFLHLDYRSDLTTFLGFYPGANLKVLEIRNMDDPLEIDIISEECPNLESLKMMLCGVWENSHKTNRHFPKLNSVHIKTGNPDTLLSFMRYNTSVKDMKISCPNEGKSKFADAFIQTVCSFKGLLPNLKSLKFYSKFPFGFTSAQKLIASLISLEYIGPIDMFTKISKTDITDLVGWVKEKNWDVVIGYKGTEYNVFSIDQSDPWKYKFVPDKGRIPVKKPVQKRTLSVPSAYSDDDDDVSAWIDGRKRSRNNSGLVLPSQCSTRKSGSIISVKKSNGSNITSVNLENEEFEFEFAMDSDGFIKNKDYRWNHQIPTAENDEDYDDYDEFDEDTMDVEELPDDAEFEWCWGEDGNLKIYEIEKLYKQDESDKSPENVSKEEQLFLGGNETEVSNNDLINNIINKDVHSDPKKWIDVPAVNVNPPVTSSLYDESLNLSVSKSLPNSKSVGKTNNDTSTSSRRAKKRVAQLTPPPIHEEKSKSSFDTEYHSGCKNIINLNGCGSSSVIPNKAAKQDSNFTKMGKIASMFEKTEEIKKPQKLQIKSKNVMESHDDKQKTIQQVPQSPRTMVVEVFEYDPMLGYCTVKRKTVPIEQEESIRKDSITSINLSYLQSPTKDIISKPDEPKEEDSDHKAEPISSESNEAASVSGITNECLNSNSIHSSQSSMKNKLPLKRPSFVEGLVPLSSMSKYDIPFLGPLLANMGKSIPAPPKSKPPSLPKSAAADVSLPKLRASKSISEDEIKTLEIEATPDLETKSAPRTDIKVEVEEKEQNVVNITVPKQDSTHNDIDHKPEEAKEWYWDYEASCWKECEADEEYEWEYLDSEDEKEIEKVEEHQSITLPIRGNSSNVCQIVLNQENLVKKDESVGPKIVVDAISSSAVDKDLPRQPDLQRDARKDSKLRGSQELLDIKEDSEDYSGIPSIAISLDKDLEKDRKHASKWGKNRKKSSRYSRQNSMDELTESMSVSQEDLLDISSPRRRRKGTVDQPSKHSLYDSSYADEELSVSVGEVSQRARRRRKDTQDDDRHSTSQDEQPREQKNSGDELSRRERTREPKTSGDEHSRRDRARESKASGDELSRRERTRENKTSGDELPRRDKSDSQLKRRNTGKKMDHEKARTSASRQDKLNITKSEKKSDIRKRDLDKSKDEEDDDTTDSDDSSRTKEPDIDEKNVTFCMWGHENCRTRSHYRYNWQWDYVQKYVDQHNKNVIPGFTPKERSIEEQIGNQEVSNKNNKPGKEGIKIRMQMLQNRLNSGKTSGAMKQNIFERDLELEILRRKKNYKF